VRVAVALVLASALLAVSGCRRVSGPSTVAPETGEERARPDAAGPHEGDSALELDARLKRLREDQTQQDVCSLATSICGVKEKLCNIADEHPGDADYQELCRKAKQECQQAQEACVGCVERHQGRQ
jgi:hypothetical protein